ncbi:hypothetical protein Y032_0004g2200 [Ancylostoma ceylanicum]|uniref:Uncharacterized protein n=1 Tax=Ancylostoma ceylanicum TaxID=53326 RepID=A0A016VXP8_9BILA|nr:hypothetical protein Y032_0004g2200 [Ancylostoma ceylanicum]
MPIGEGSIPLDTKYGYIHRTLNKYNEQVITPRYCKFQRTQLYKHGTGWVHLHFTFLTSLERSHLTYQVNMSKEKKKEAGAGAPQAPGASVIQAKDEAYLLNRPGEPEFKMTMTPLKVIFICTPEKKPVWSDVRVTNSTKDKQSYKVRRQVRSPN